MALIYCPECGKQISDKAKYCINCGYPIWEYVNEKKELKDEPKKEIPIRNDICPKCGSEISPVFRVCTKCGYSQYGNAEIDYKNNHMNDGATDKVSEHIPVDYSPKSIEQKYESKKPKKKKKHIFSKIIIFLILFYIFIYYVDKGEDNINETESIRDIQTEYSETEINNDGITKSSITEVETDISNLPFIDAMKIVTSESIANGAYDVLTNKLGFSDVEFEKRLGDTSNYQITADGTYTVITAMDDYYRVYIPDTSYVFYEDGNVLMTAQEFNDRKIDFSDSLKYYLMAQEIVKDCLSNPNTAKFPSINTSSDIAMAKTDDIITVQSYVDAKNDFNANVRMNYTVQFSVVDMGTYSYNTTYINIDGEEAGVYTDIN